MYENIFSDYSTFQFVFFKKDKSYSVYIEQYKNLKGDIVNKGNYPESRENMPICFINIELHNVRDV